MRPRWRVPQGIGAAAVGGGCGSGECPTEAGRVFAGVAECPGCRRGPGNAAPSGRPACCRERHPVFAVVDVVGYIVAYVEGGRALAAGAPVSALRARRPSAGLQGAGRAEADRVRAGQAGCAAAAACGPPGVRRAGGAAAPERGGAQALRTAGWRTGGPRARAVRTHRDRLRRRARRRRRGGLRWGGRTEHMRRRRRAGGGAAGPQGYACGGGASAAADLSPQYR